MAKKIVIGIALDGDSEVRRKLQEVGEAGRNSLGGITRTLAGAGRAIQDGLGGLTAGLGSVLGRSPLAATAAGAASAALGIERLRENAQRARERLAALGDPKGLDRLAERARNLGTDVASLQPREERFRLFQQERRAQDTSIIRAPGFRPGPAEEAAANVRTFAGGSLVSPPSLEAFGRFDNALLRQIRRDVPDAETAQRIAADFQERLFSGGLTPDLLRSLQRASPNAANLLTTQLGPSLGRGFENPAVLAAEIERRGRPLDATSVINAGARPAPEFEKAADNARGLTQRMEEWTAGIKRFGETVGDQTNTFSDQIGPYLRAEQPLPVRPTYTPRRIDDFPQFASPIPVTPVPSPTAPAAAPVTPPADVNAATSEVTAAGRELAGAISDVASGVRGAAPQVVQGKAAGGVVRNLDGGGHVLGPGTTTSDSIPAMLSNDEFVIKASSAKKIGLRTLDWLNAGMPGGPANRPGYAEGGAVNLSPQLGANDILPTGSYSITPTEDGGAIINGVLYPPGSPILENPIVKQALARARSAAGQDSGGKSGYRSPFIIRRVPGSFSYGSEGGAAGSLPRFANGGAVGGGLPLGGPISVPGFADGGLADVMSFGPAPSLEGLGAPAGGGSMGHMDVDLRTNHGDFRMMAPAEVARAMAAAARDSADARTGTMPSWVKGR